MFKNLTFWKAIFYLIILGGILYTIRYIFTINKVNSLEELNNLDTENL